MLTEEFRHQELVKNRKKTTGKRVRAGYDWIPAYGTGHGRVEAHWRKHTGVKQGAKVHLPGMESATPPAPKKVTYPAKAKAVQTVVFKPMTPRKRKIQARKNPNIISSPRGPIKKTFLRPGFEWVKPYDTVAGHWRKKRKLPKGNLKTEIPSRRFQMQGSGAPGRARTSEWLPSDTRIHRRMDS